MEKRIKPWVWVLYGVLFSLEATQKYLKFYLFRFGQDVRICIYRLDFYKLYCIDEKRIQTRPLTKNGSRSAPSRKTDPNSTLDEERIQVRPLTKNGSEFDPCQKTDQNRP